MGESIRCHLPSELLLVGTDAEQQIGDEDDTDFQDLARDVAP